MSQSDCIALVTGTSSGIGRVVADLLLRAGWTVIGVSRRKVELGHPLYRHIQLDLADLQNLQEIAERDLAPRLKDERWQRIALVNNAALIGSMQPMEEAEPPRLAEVFAVNTVAPMFLMGFVVRVAPRAAVLRIVNVSTGAAVNAFPGLSDYGCSKAALRLAGMTLAAELESDKHPGGPRKNAAVLSYAPGIVDTAMQYTARSHAGPWNDAFVDFHEQGLLQPPEKPSREIVDFLAGAAEGFSEHRFGET
jgi:NAD(P)-dependent dehydrogenase (short-subunit alcohol dehydrogenase family)